MSNKQADISEFIIEYDYFRLSSSAEVQKRIWKGEPYFKCFLHSSAQTLNIKQIKEPGGNYWIDMGTDNTTPLSNMGQAIENKLSTH